MKPALKPSVKLSVTLAACVLAAGLLCSTASPAEDAPKTVADTPAATGQGSQAAAGSGSTAAVKVHYKKHKQVDFTSKTIEGKLKRPETALITASEGLDSNGILRLRENFLDKFAADAGEEVP